MTTPALTHIDNTQDVIHSHDVIARIVELEGLKAAAEAEGQPFTCEDESELCDLVDLELQCLDRAPWTWRNGTVLERFYADGPMEPGRRMRVDFASVAYWLRVG